MAERQPSIIRVERRTHGFVIVDRRAVEDPALTLKATGLLVYLLGKPDDWQIRREQLDRCKRDGRDAISSALGELEDRGYLTRERRSGPGGRFEWEYVVHELPTIDGKPGDGATIDGKTIDGKPGDLLKTSNQEPSPNGEGGDLPAAPDRGRKVEDEVTERALAKVLPQLARGYAFDVRNLLAQVWTEAWQEAADHGGNPKVVGMRICAAYLDTLGVKPDWARIGRLVGQYGKLTLWGLEAAVQRGAEYHVRADKASSAELRQGYLCRAHVGPPNCLVVPSDPYTYAAATCRNLAAEQREAADG